MAREEAIDILKHLNDFGHHTYAEEKEALSMAIEALQQESVWILTSERLPENESYVLTTIRVPGRQAQARSGWYQDGLFMNDNGDTWKSTDKEVIAHGYHYQNRMTSARIVVVT